MGRGCKVGADHGDMSTEVCMEVHCLCHTLNVHGLDLTDICLNGNNLARKVPECILGRVALNNGNIADRRLVKDGVVIHVPLI